MQILNHKAWILAVLALLGLSPLMVLEGRNLWQQEHLQFYPLAWSAAVYFLWTHIGRSQQQTRLRRVVAIAAACAAAVVGLGAAWYFSPWLAHLSAILWFAFLAFLQCARAPMGSILAMIGLLAITLPLPFNLDNELILWLQQLSTWATAALMDGLGIPYSRQGTILQLEDKRLFVEEACSGVTSMYSLAAIALGLSLLQQSSGKVTLMSLLTIPLWSGLGNFLRLATIVVAWHYFQVDLTHGIWHTILGAATFAIAALGWMLSALLLQIFEAPIPVDRNDLQENQWIAWFNRKPRTFPEENVAAPGAAFQIALGAIGLLAVGLLAAAIPTGWLTFQTLLNDLRAPRITEQDERFFPGEEGMPERLKVEARRVRFQEEKRERTSIFGSYSRTWTYRMAGGHLLTASLDFPFTGWQRLYVCYENTGWEVTGYDLMEADPGDQGWPWVEMKLKNKYGQHGRVLFCFLDELGQHYIPKPEEVRHRLRDNSIQERARQTLPGLLKEVAKARLPNTYQFQVVLFADQPLSESTVQRMHQGFLETRDHAKSEVEKMLRRKDPSQTAYGVPFSPRHFGWQRTSGWAPWSPPTLFRSLGDAPAVPLAELSYQERW
jgi:exosortase